MKINPEQIDADAAKVVERLRRYDHLAYVVGGSVRDLLLGLKPKDFDVATSATPNEIRRLFRNCRIIGRRFRLAHVFFGSKIIETSTFRANPREVEEEAAGGATETSTEGERQDLLIRRDNVFGTAEEDARRRDFTINGLYYDIENGQVIDYVDGMKDLEARLVRTIGDPDVRFREDPIRILRAVKFAARCNLSIEPETYRRMLDHAEELQKCAQARVSEEFYRLLRAGAAKRSIELLLESGLLKVLSPKLLETLQADDADSEARTRKARTWAYLAALDRSTAKRESPPSNPLILATLIFPALREALHPDTTGVRDIKLLVSQTMAPIVEQVKASRREAELALQILLAMRFVMPSSNPGRRKPRLAGREFMDDALRLQELVADAEALAPELVASPQVAEGDGTAMSAEAEERLARELETPGEFERRRGGRGRGGRSFSEGTEGGAEGAAPVETGGRHGGGRDSASRDSGGPRPGEHRGRTVRPGAPGKTPIPDLGLLGPCPPPPPPFLGTGTFGGRWSVSE
ncbi:MAG TPA: polynucleotide adenylyltransferase PcnB [Polyangia bacterium]